MRLTVPDTLQIKKGEGNYFIYDSLHGNMLKVSPDVIYVLERLKAGLSLVAIAKQHGAGDLTASLKPLIDRHLLRRPGENRPFSPNRAPAKPAPLYLRFYVGTACTLRCDYCHIGATDGVPVPGDTIKMKWETAGKTLGELKKWLPAMGRDRLIIQFYGGEPLLNLPLIERIMAESTRVLGRDGRVEFVLNTNGSLFSEKIAVTLARYRPDLHLSLDGISPQANSHRKLRSGKPSLGLVLKNLRQFRKHGLGLQLNSSLTGANLDHLSSLIDFAAGEGIQRLYLTLTAGPLAVADPEIIASRINAALRQSITKGVMFYGPWHFILEQLSRPGNFRRAAGAWLHHLFIRPGGGVYLKPYPHVEVGKCGQISGLQQSAGWQRLQKKWEQEIDACAGCEIAAGCLMRCKMNTMYHTGKQGTETTECKTVKRVIDHILRWGGYYP